jgi:hypothetical protein
MPPTSFLPRTVSQQLESCALKASIGSFVEDEGTARNFLTRDHLAQDYLVIACLMYRGKPTTDLSCGALQQGEPVRAECNCKIVKSALQVSGEATGQIRLMLAKNVDRE